MAIALDHVLVPARNRRTSAAQIARILDVPWSESGVGPFSPVFVNDGLTLDVDEAETFPVLHFCFRMSDAELDGLLARLREIGIAYRSQPHGPADMTVNTSLGGRFVYWSEPDGHVWEALTESYARQPATWGDPAHDSEMD